MRIALVHYTQPPVVGGVERVIGDQARALRALGHEVEVVDGSEEGKSTLRAWLERGRPRPPSRREQGKPFERVRRWQEEDVSPYFDPSKLVEKHRHVLPHWQQAGKLFFITWRLADALPQEKLAKWRKQKADWEALHPRPWSDAEAREYEVEFEDRINQWLDQGMGDCLLRDEAMRQPLVESLHYADGRDYDLVSYVLMPNHVHVVFRLRQGVKLEDVIKAWKSVSSRKMKRLKAGLEAVWQEGYWDRLIRGPEHLAEVLSYVRRNPLQARLREGEWVWWECGEEASDGTRAPRLGGEWGHSRSAVGEASEGTRTPVVIVHNVFTMPFDLAWTRELTALAAAETGVVWVNWIHDVAAVNPAYAEAGWNEAAPRALPVAVSEVRAREWAGVAGVPLEAVTVIPNGVDPARVLGLTDRVTMLAAARGLWEAELLLLLPARLVRRKNIEFGIDLLAALRDERVNARLIVTGAPDPHQEDGRRYFDELKARAKNLDVLAETVFAGGEGTLDDDDVRSLYRLCDALFFPSHSEGFGLPLLEAALHRLPVWCADIEVHRAVTGAGARFFDPGGNPSALARQMRGWLAEDPMPGLRRRVWREHSWLKLCKERLEPLLETAMRRP